MLHILSQLWSDGSPFHSAISVLGLIRDGNICLWTAYSSI